MPVGTGDDGVWEDPDPAQVANVGTTPPGPGLSSDAPDHSTEPHPVANDGVESDQGEQDEEPLPEFDPRVRQDFEGLLYLGKLTAQFEWMGHTFVIRTLTVGEVLEIGLIHREYVGTMADVKAYQAALSAACVVQIDRKFMPFPLTNEADDTPVRNRFEYVLNHWFPPTLDAIYENYLLLEARVDKVMEAMGKAYGWTFTMPTLSGVAA